MADMNPKLLIELTHRLQSLEADLLEASRSREISEADYASRLGRLRYALDYSEKIKILMQSPAHRGPKASQVDLPGMGDCSRLEQKIITRFVAETKNHIADLASKAGQASEWAIDAAHKSTGWFKAIRRLSSLRREMSRADSNFENIRRARGAVEDFIAQSAIGKTSENPSIAHKDLVAVFREFEMATDRVTTLRARVKSESTRNNDMRNWLNQNSINRRMRNPEKAPPEPNDVFDVTSTVFERLTGGAKLANERLVVARQLAKAMKKNEPTPKLVELSKPEVQHQILKELSKNVVQSKLSRKAKKKLKDKEVRE